MAITRPTISLNFANARLAAARALSVTRPAVARVFSPTGRLVAVPANAPAFNFDLNTGEALGLATMGGSSTAVLYNRDLTNAVWVKSSMTAALDQVGLDFIASSASSITATGANGTVIQNITSVSAVSAIFVYLKRLVGTGVVSMTLDGGLSWTPVTVTDSWQKVTLPRQTLVNPQVGFKLTTSGDSIAVDLVSVMASLAEPLPTITAGASVAVSNDIISYDATGLVNPAEGTLFVEFTATDVSVSTFRTAVSLGVDAVSPDEVIRLGVNGPRAGMRVYSGSAEIFTLDVARPAGVLRMAGAYKNSSWYFAVNGTLSPIQSSATVPAFANTLYIGSINGANGNQMIYGHVRRVMYWPRQMTTGEIQAITA